MRTLLTTLTAMAMLGAGFPAGAQVRPPPGIGIRLVEAPAALRNDPRAQAYVIDHVSPGARFSRKFEVSNGTRERVSLDLYVAAAELGTGRFDILPGRARNELAEWSTVSPARVTLAPGARARATLSVTVPADASAGERYGAVLAELPAPPATAGVTVGSRVGIRMYLSVGGGGEPASDFAIDSLTARRRPDGRPEVATRVRNTGGRALDVTGQLRLENGPGGLSAGPFPVTLGTTLRIGGVAVVDIALAEQVPDGPWDAHITLRSGKLEREARARITFPSEPGTASASAQASLIEEEGELGAAAPVAGGVALLAALSLLLLVAWRRRRGRDDRETSVSRR